MPPRLRHNALLLTALLIALFTSACDRGELQAQAGIPTILSRKDLAETSGIAASITQPGRLWLHDDSGNPARLFAITATGDDLGTWPISDTDKVDWEDMASFQQDGVAWLAIADTGDNGGLRKTVRILFIREPLAGTAPTTLKPERSIEFRWPDGALDCEAMAIDVRNGKILLVSKKRQPPQLFELPLQPKTRGVQTARRVAILPALPQPSAKELADDPTAKYSPQITAADLSPDGLTLAVLAYRHILLFRRDTPFTPWSTAMQQQPRELTMPLIPQPEALAWSRDGRALYLTGEMSPTLLYVLRP